ncbi:MAG: ATP-binding protein [Candidatus Enteromonas sp.]
MFIGREKELIDIRRMLRKTSAAVLVYGKRKVGKTTLILEALKESEDPLIYFECLRAPIEDNVKLFSETLFRSGVLPYHVSFPSFWTLSVSWNKRAGSLTS